MALRFLKFNVYHDAKKLHHQIVLISKNFPREFLYLKDQLRRSSLSTILVIAEGSAKRSDKDFNRYLEMGMGSVNETSAGLDVALFESLISEDDYKKLINLCEEVVNQLGGFSKKLINK